MLRRVPACGDEWNGPRELVGQRWSLPSTFRPALLQLSAALDPTSSASTLLAQVQFAQEDING
jgi:hypothetical protein